MTEIEEMLAESFGRSIESRRTRLAFDSVKTATKHEIASEAKSMEMLILDLPEDMTIAELRDALHTLAMRT